MVAGLFGSGFKFFADMSHAPTYGIAAFFNGFLSLVGYMTGGFFGFIGYALSSFFGFVPIAVGILFCA